jgi:CubicO group peptidase (beta-lactamase class C family)
MELQDYISKHIGQALGWERWGFGYKNAPDVNHTPGGGGIVLRPTDMLRFGYLLLNKGKWKNQQIIPADYVRLSSQTSAYNPHFPYSFQFNVNTNGFYPTLPRDAFWKVGSGNHCIYVVPSLDLVVWKLGGRDGQYDPRDTGIRVHPEALKNPDDRKDWKSTVNKDNAIIKTLELIIGSIEKSKQ